MHYRCAVYAVENSATYLIQSFVPKPSRNNLKKLIGERVRQLREARGITSQEKLGELADDLHRTFIGRVERGETNISIENLATIINALEVSLAEFFAPFDEPKEGK
jgi:ribosome-binding protein aMBF1 (putative translation factor)